MMLLLVDHHTQHLRIEAVFHGHSENNERKILLSQTGKGALQLPLGKHVSSEAPIKELPLAQDSCTRMLIFVSFVFIVSPRRTGISGQFTA